VVGGRQDDISTAFCKKTGVRPVSMACALSRVAVPVLPGNEPFKSSIMDMRARSQDAPAGALAEKSHPFDDLALLASLVAAAAFFVPFAVNTSPWDAIMLRVPGDQGNWWHLLLGVPFLLPYAMIWLLLRQRFSASHPAAAARRLVWVLVAVSACGTVSVEVPFLLHRAGTSEGQRLLVMFLGLGSLMAGAAIVVTRRRSLSPTRTCLVGLLAAYLANAAICLLVYAEAKGSVRSRLGWFVTAAIVWPLVLELFWIFVSTGGNLRAAENHPAA